MCVLFFYRFVTAEVDGRGRALRRIWFGGRSIDTLGGAIPLTAPPFCRDTGAFVMGLTDGCTNVAFTLSVDEANVSGVSPRLKLLFELPDDRLCNKNNNQSALQITEYAMNSLTLFDENRPKSVSESVRFEL